MSLSGPRPLPCDGLSILNARPKKLRGSPFLHELVSRQDKTGQTAAIDFLSENGQHAVISYPELHAASLALAQRISYILRSSSPLDAVDHEAQDPLIIPILSPQSPQLYVAILAVLKAGGAFCPLDANVPPNRVEFVLEDVKAKIVLATRDLATKISTDNKTYRIIFIDDALENSKFGGDEFGGHPELCPEDLAYVMYTSGSTGKPKGVTVSHLAATQSILAHERWIPPFSRFLQFAAPTFDVSIFEIFFPLFRGATLVGCNRAEMLTDLAGVLQTMQVDACELTPSVAGSLLRQRTRAPGLRLLLTIGEMLTDPVIREFGGDENNKSILWGMYGPTEAAIHCTIEPEFPSTSERTNIGRPLDTVSVFVIRLVTDSSAAFHFEVLPVGETGELALGGLQLASYYLNRPEQTAAFFIDTPWGRVYRTGDKARIKSDGTIECLGRIEESQVKLNGQRLELGEVEQVLLQVHGCYNAVAAVILNTLVAFVATGPEHNLHATLRARCESWLPAFMVPKDIVAMENFPQLPSGKIDRKRLIDNYVTEKPTIFTNEEVVDDSERLLCDIATAVLGESVFPLTELSVAKLDSLAAIEYASTLREKGIGLTPVDILSAKTIRELRSKIDRVVTLPLAPEPKATCNQNLNPYPKPEEFNTKFGNQIDDVDRIETATSLQLSMIAETLKDAHLYINEVEFKLDTAVTLEALKSSLKSLAERNEILRTGFVFLGTQFCQVIWKQLDDTQLHDTIIEETSVAELDDIKSFLLRPMRVHIRPPSSEVEHFTLLLTLHHAVYDGWTLDLMIEDLSLLLSGKLPPMRPQFSQVMTYLRHNTQVDRTASIEFWAEYLRGVGVAATSNFKTVAVAEHQRSVITTKIALHPESVKDLMLRASIGPQVLFQGCLMWLWATVQGVQDIVIGSVSSGRSLPLPGIDKLMGPCMTTLPLRVNVSRHRTILELLQTIHSTNREILRHGHIPLSDIHEIAGLSANNRLFDVIFAYQESPVSRRKRPKIVRESWHHDATEAKLLVEIIPYQDHYICQMTVHTDVIPLSLAEAFMSHMSLLVSHFSRNAGSLVSSIPQCFSSSSLSHFNDKPRSVEGYSSLAEMVEKSAFQFSSATALCFATSTSLSAGYLQLSYHDLNSKANQIARCLQQHGCRPGDVIAIVMEKSILLYCSILGVLKTGCAYLPILPSTPIERKGAIFRQAEPHICIVDTASSPLTPKLESLSIINIELIAISSYQTANLSTQIKPTDLAYVIYTSGTTGIKLKGVAVTNKNILSNISILSGIYPREQSGSMLQACSQAFDMSVFEIFYAWANGMCLCATTNDTLFEDFGRTVRSFGITHLCLTVTVASMLNPDTVPTVKFLVTAGEPMTDELLDRWSEYLYHGYGPSETTNICTVRKVSKGDSSQFLGHSFQNTSTFVLDPGSIYLTPIGCLGELCFGGDQVASGYLKLPKETATKFIDHPDHGRLHRSGDLGRMLPDGSIIIQGRMDTQTKLRGFRIEFQEIQAIASKTGMVRACRTILVAHEIWNLRQLVMFYVPFEYENDGFRLLPLDEGIEVQAQVLRHALQSYLPAYTVPILIVPISILPLTPSGKVDDRELRDSIAELAIDDLNAYSFPGKQADTKTDWSETETQIAKVIMDLVLKDSKEISRWTSFSALGLDSISAIPVVRKLQSVMKKRVPLSLFLQHPSINRLALAIDEIDSFNDAIDSSAPLLPETLVETTLKHCEAKGLSVAKVLPCTPLQEAMIMSSLNNSNTVETGVAYYNQMLFRLNVPYRVIMNHWDEIIQRHEILRAIFIVSNDIHYPAIQVILSKHLPKWEVLEVEDALLQDRAAQHAASVSASMDHDMPPMALAIIRTKSLGDHLSFVCHHAMYDGISMRIMLSEVEALCNDRQLAESPSIEPFLREVMSPHPNQDDFWKQVLSGFRPTPLRPKELIRDAMPLTVTSQASKNSLNQLKTQLRDMGVSMLSLIQAAWAIALSILTQTADVSFGSVTSGRSIALATVDRLVAPCFNTLPIRINLSLSTTIMEVVMQLQSLNSEVLQHQFTGLRHIQKLADAHLHLFDTLLILQPPAAPLDDAVWSLVYEDGSMDVPVVCEVIPSERQDTLTVQLYRDESKFSYEALQLIGKTFGHVLDACLKFPASHACTSEILPADCHKEIARLFHRTQTIRVSEVLLNESIDHEESWSPSEMTVRRLLAKLAGLPEERIDRLTPIYQYGLDSIAAIQLATLLRRQDISISAIDVIEHPTCAGIAAAIRSSAVEDISTAYDFNGFHEQVEADVLRCNISLEAIEAIFPCTTTQQGLLSQFLDSKGRNYFNYSSWAWSIAARPEATARAWSQLANHHQILRAGFIPVNHVDSSYAMVVYRIDNFTTPVSIYAPDAFDVEGWLANVRADALSTLAQPPWRVALVASEDTDGNASLTIHLAIHHALYDAFTLRNLLRDLTELISHNNKPKMIDIGPALSHYFSLTQSSLLAGESFWKQKANEFSFHKFPVMTPLHVDDPLMLMESRSCEKSSTLLRQAASRASVTMQAVLQATWTRLLSAYIGESRVTFGIVLDGRTTDLARQSYLPMIATLPVIAENVPSNSELVQQMMRYNSQLRRVHFMPMAHIQRQLGIAGTMFDTIMIYQAYDRTTENLPLRVLNESASVEYPISLEIEELSSNETRLSLSFRASVLPRGQAVHILDQFEAVLMDLLLPSDGPTPNLIDSRPELFSIIPSNCESLPIDAHLLHELLESSANSVPSATALEFVKGPDDFSTPQSWTYQELDALGNQVAHFITRQGTSPGRIIATCFNKCPIAYFTLLGILKAGCAFLCLDPSAPSTRQIFILKDSKAAMLLLSESFGWAGEAPLPVHTLNGSIIASLPTSPPILERQIFPSDSCYCLYTSGTTGTPKGCLMSHENTVQAMAAFKYLFAGRWNPKSRWLQFAAFHFDVSVLEQYWSWYVGITVVAAPKDVILSDLAMTISKLRITHIDLTPSLARLISPDECPSLCEGVFITGGEKLRSDILVTWGPKRVIYNAYGPTETTIGVTMYRGVPHNGRPSNIGNLFPNVGAYIVEPGTESPVLRGGVGELCVSGKLVGQGYLNREALTRERFPVFQASGDRVYRTGDLVRILCDDSLDFLGRADDQVKLRGQRLEIGEINHAIREGLAGKVNDVTTMVVRRESQDVDLLVSFVALTSDFDAARELQVYYDATHLEFAARAQQACRSCLATYMVPSFLIFISRIPLSPNNKVDVNHLKKLFSELSHEQLQTLSAFSDHARRALNTLESRVLEAIYQVVQVQENDLTPSTSIFQLGIDSITATRLAKQLRAVGFASATPSIILRHPQIGRLSQALSRQIPESLDSIALQGKQPIKGTHHRYLGLVCGTLGRSAVEVEYIAPCTPLQQGIIARSKTQETELAYFNQFQLRLKADVSINRLKSALSRVIKSYSILRTAFIETPEGFLQVALKNRPLRWSEIEANVESLEPTIHERRRHWVEKNQRVLKWPIEADHMEVSGQHHLLLRLFHGVYDARSLDIIFDSLESEYEGRSRPTGPDFISVLHEEHILSHQEPHPFWRPLLENHRFQPMPSLMDKPTASNSIIHKSMKFEGLEHRRMRLQVTHQTLLQAAWLHTLSQYLGNSPTIGVILSGRSFAINDIDLVVGPLFNTLPLRVGFTEDTTWASLTQEIQKVNNDLLAHVYTPLRDIQKLYSNGEPLFDTLFTFDQDYKTAAQGDRTLWSLQDSYNHPDYPLAIEIIKTTDDTLRITLAAQGKIADESALSLLMDKFTESLTSIITDDPLLLDRVSMAYSKVHEPVLAPVLETSSSISSEFVWDEQLYDVRRELAILTRLDEMDISETTNLLALGLDSIDMIKLAGRLSRLGYSVSVGALMKQPTLESIRASLKKSPLPAAKTMSPGTDEFDSLISILEDVCFQKGIKRQEVEAILPPTPLQDSMVAEMLQSDFHTYFNHDVLELPLDVDVDRLKSALSDAYAGSPILRTVFVEIDDPRINSAYCQVVRRHELEFTPAMDIADMRDISRVTNLARLRASESGGTSHLFQVNFAAFEGRTLLILSIAHALYDGWSLPMLHQDIHDAYQGNYIPRQSYKPHLSRMLFQPDTKSHQFWTDLLNGAEPTTVPKAAILPGDRHIQRVERISSRSVIDIRTLCKGLRVTPQVIGQACWAAVLATLTRSLDVVFGVVLSGRDTEESQRLMFPTMNTVPLKLTLHGTIARFLEYAQGIMSTIVEYQHTPMRETQRHFSGQGNRGFNTIFLLQNSRRNGTSATTFLKSIDTSSAIDYPLCAELDLDGKAAVWHIACDSNYMELEEVEALGHSLESVLDYFARGTDQNILDFSSHGPQTVSICGLKPVALNPEPQRQQNDVSTSDHTPNSAISRTQQYETLVDVISDLSKVEKHEIDISHSIFHLGLDSISAIKASSMLRKRGLQISTRDLITTSSIYDILEKVNQVANEDPKSSAENTLRLNFTIGGKDIRTILRSSGIDTDSVEAILPALPVQEYMLSVWQNSGGTTFFSKFEFKISGLDNPTTVANAWIALVNEMPVLRTHLVSTTSSDIPFLQVILKSEFTTKNATTILPDPEFNGQWEFVYTAAPFYVVQILGEPLGQASLNFHIHHALYDGISLPIILNRFAEMCNSNSLVVSTFDISPWCQFALNHIIPEIRAQRESFWKSYLQGYTARPLNQASQSTIAAKDQRVSKFQRTTINGIDELRLRASVHGVSTQMLLFAAYAKASCTWCRTGSHSVDGADRVFGVYLANRASYLGIEDAPFPTLNILPLRVRDASRRSINAIAADIRADITEISKIENSTASLHEIRRWTSLHIDTFVNILSRPNEAAFPELGSVTLTEKPDHHSPPMGTDISMYLIAPDDKSLSSNAVAQSYPSGIDVELALHDDMLDIGIFGPSSLLSTSQANDMIAAILAEVEPLCTA